jgi:hypothetical protein
MFSRNKNSFTNYSRINSLSSENRQWQVNLLPIPDAITGPSDKKKRIKSYEIL